MQKWEHKLELVLKFSNSYRARLDELEEEGWEFAAVLTSDQPPAQLVLFKRPKPTMLT
jgi:hypothetical protein